MGITNGVLQVLRDMPGVTENCSLSAALEDIPTRSTATAAIDCGCAQWRAGHPANKDAPGVPLPSPPTVAYTENASKHLANYLAVLVRALLEWAKDKRVEELTIYIPLEGGGIDEAKLRNRERPFDAAQNLRNACILTYTKQLMQAVVNKAQQGIGSDKPKVHLEMCLSYTQADGACSKKLITASACIPLTRAKCSCDMASPFKY